MKEPSIAIRSATQAESPQGISCIVAAFIADPFARFVWPSSNAYLAHAAPFMSAFGGKSFENETADVTEDFCGAALWLPPGVHPNAESMVEILRGSMEPDRLSDMLATLDEMDSYHPKEPCWYLPLIGVDPYAQGRGLGGALMRHAVDRCDRDAAVAYLESSNPRNISLYERFGFEVLAKIQKGSGPLVTPMLRRPGRSR